MQPPDETCARPGCDKPLGDGYAQLPEDRRLPEPPRFCDTTCACEERFRRKWDKKQAA